MASENVTQLIEKKVLTGVLLGTWNNDDLREDDDDNDEKFFVNSFTEVKNHEQAHDNHTRNLADEKVPHDYSKTSSKESTVVSNTENDKDSRIILEFSVSSELDHKKEDEKGISVEGENDRNIDEVDYFDSDEEYMETHGQRYDKEHVLDVFEEYNSKSLKDRYSEGVEQYKNVPVYRRSIQTFAKTNHFEIYDVIPDGNCMFRAIADQFMINGRIGFSAERLRSTAIDYLRDHPYNEDGNHIQSFLCTESWEDYLSRMSKSNEWSDHIILQAVVDAYNLEVIVFNVFLDDIRRTEVIAENKNGKPMQIFLGHLGEFHYLSLRPDHWPSLWPYKSLLYRILMCSKHSTKTARQKQIQKKIKDMGANEIVTEDEYLDMLHIVYRLQNKDCLNDSSNYMHASSTKPSKERCLWYLDMHGLDVLQFEETEDSLSNIFYDPMHIDVLTGIPLPHLSYILKQLFPLYMIRPFMVPCSSFSFQNYYVHYLGSSADGNNLVLKDISKSQRKRDFYHEYRRKQVRDAVVTPRNKTVLYTNVTEGQPSVMNIYADSTSTHPGYCQLRLPPSTVISERCIFQNRSGKFLTEMEVNEVIPLPSDVKIKYNGLFCTTFPPSAKEWRDRERKFTFPCRYLVNLILKRGCTLIKKAHPQSKDPNIEWKYNFSMAEHAIFTAGLTDNQMHGFCVFKILIDNVTFHLTKPFKNKCLKAVFLNALEDIPCEAWDSNFSGCILFLINALIACLKARVLPHYFIPRNNLIDCFSDAEIHAICVNVECIRMFPLTVIQNISENHGYSFAPKLVKMVFKNCKSFVQNSDMATVFMNAFIPGTVCSMKVLTRLGFYETAYQLLRYVHEQMLLIPMPDDCYETPSFVEFFHVALKKLHQRSSRVILARLFDIRFKTNLLTEFINSKATLAKDVLPWTMDYKTENVEVPKDKATDFVFLADLFYELSLREYDKWNSTLATLTLETAIKCVEKAIQMDAISIDEITDDTLKKEIKKEKERIIKDLKKKLKRYYIQMFVISKQYSTLVPLENHMGAIERLCAELPEMTFIVSAMFTFLGRDDKAKEYEAKSEFQFKGRGPVFAKYNV